MTIPPHLFEWHAAEGRLLAWVNDCPLRVDLEPDADGLQSYAVLGHGVGAAKGIARACRAAVQAALAADRAESDCRYLHSAGGPWGFFADHGARDPGAAVAALVSRRKVQGHDAGAGGRRFEVVLPEGATSPGREPA